MQTLHDHWTRFTVGSSSILILLGNPLSISSGDDCSLLLCTYLACRVVVYTQLHYHLQEKDIPQWQIQYPYYFCNNYFVMSSDWLAKWGCTEQSFTNVMHDHVLHLWMLIRTFISWFVLFFWSRKKKHNEDISLCFPTIPAQFKDHVHQKSLEIEAALCLGWSILPC